MNESTLLESLRSKVSSEIGLESEGINRFIVYTPFMFDDGDHYVVILKREHDNWVLTDEGHTFMHLSYTGVDLNAPTRAKIIEEALSAHGVESYSGELKLTVPQEDFGNALFSFIQALARTSTVSQITRERVATSFFEDLRELIIEVVPQGHLSWDWHDPDRDPEGHYVVDCRINHRATPWFVFAVNSTDKCKSAMITCLTYELKKLSFNSLVVFEDQSAINRKALAQLSDVVGKQFASLSDRRRIKGFFNQEVLGSANPWPPRLS